MRDGTFELQTERLRLRPWTLGDVDAVFAYASDHAEQFCAACVLADWDAHQQFAIEFEGTVVGDINIRIDRASSVGTFGYGIAPACWGKGIVTEAARAIVAHAFESLGLEKVSATADAENIASWRVMEKLGMKREAYFRSHRVHRGERRDVVQYGLLATEYRAR